MYSDDLKPHPNAAGANLIKPTANNRLGCVLSALYSFWLARQAAIDRNAQSGGTRRDAYSLVFFNNEPSTCIENDFASSPDELLTAALRYKAGGLTNFTRALERAQNIMDSHWSTERYKALWAKLSVASARYADMHYRTPVIIFLSDGEDFAKDETISEFCRGAVRKGFVVYFLYLLVTDSMNARRPLSFQTVYFGCDTAPYSLRRMADIAYDVQKNTPRDPLHPFAVNIPSSCTEALDTVRKQRLLLHSRALMRTFDRCTLQRLS